jgi:hypothetical protein
MNWRYWIHRRRAECLLLELDARRRIMSPKPKTDRVKWAILVICIFGIILAQVLAWMRAGGIGV